MSKQINWSDRQTGAAQHRATILPLDRFNSFSDGVLAIVITLLVLELPVPSLSKGLIPALGELWPDLLGYGMSFAYVGGFWISHAHLTGSMKRANSMAYGLNLLLLLFVTLLPFTTKLLIENLVGPALSIAAIVYGLNVLIASVVLSVLMFYVIRRPQLLDDSLANAEIRRLYNQRWVAIGLGVFAVVLAVAAPAIAVALYLITALLLVALPLLSIFLAHRNAG